MRANDILFRDVERGLSDLSKKTGLSYDDIIAVIKERKSDSIEKTIPISIFNDRRISSLEAIVKYLREQKGLSYKSIAELLSRNYGPIAVTYRNSRKKLTGSLDTSSELRLPISIFSHPSFSVLECIVRYLKDEIGLSFHQIAHAMSRDDRTIWTAYHRSEVKAG